MCVSLGFISRDLVATIGMGHGALFVLYVVLLILAARKQAWSMGVWFLLFLSALIPFAFVLVEVFLEKELRKNKIAL